MGSALGLRVGKKPGADRPRDDAEKARRRLAPPEAQEAGNLLGGDRSRDEKEKEIAA
jgi:hypothetical protein